MHLVGFTILESEALYYCVRNAVISLKEVTGRVQKHLESFEMWCCRRMEKISWSDHVRNEEVLLRVKEQTEGELDWSHFA